MTTTQFGRDEKEDRREGGEGDAAEQDTHVSLTGSDTSQPTAERFRGGEVTGVKVKGERFTWYSSGCRGRTECQSQVLPRTDRQKVVPEIKEGRKMIDF